MKTIFLIIFLFNLFSYAQYINNLQSTRDLQNLYDNNPNQIQQSYSKKQNDNYPKQQKQTSEFEEKILWYEQLRQEWLDTAWVDLSLMSNIFDDRFNLLEWKTSYYNNPFWENQFKENFQYNELDNIIQSRYYSWILNQWYGEAKYLFNYNPDHLLFEKIRLDSNRITNLWENKYLDTYQYGANNKITENIFKTWNNNEWLNNTRYTYDYDSLDNLIEARTLNWDGVQWRDGYRIVMTYDENIITNSTTQNWINDQWNNLVKHTFEYDENNNRIENLNQYWNSAQWNNNKLELNTFDENNNLTNILTQGWADNKWNNSTNITYIYSNNILIEETIEYWDGSNWNYDRKYVSYYNADDKLQAKEDHIWFNNEWRKSGRYVYNYNKPTDINEYQNQELEYYISNNYPNPFNPVTSINYEIQLASYVQIKVYDVIGKEIAVLVNEEKEAGKYVVSFNASTLSSGVYFYQINAGDYIETKKMILLK